MIINLVQNSWGPRQLHESWVGVYWSTLPRPNLGSWLTRDNIVTAEISVFPLFPDVIYLRYASCRSFTRLGTLLANKRYVNRTVRLIGSQVDRHPISFYGGAKKVILIATNQIKISCALTAFCGGTVRVTLPGPFGIQFHFKLQLAPAQKRLYFQTRISHVISSALCI